MYEVYIIQSELDCSFYIGYSSNAENRLEQHNRGSSRYTKTKLPWRLVYKESYDSKSEAIKRERFLKNQRNKDFYLRLIKNQSEV